MCEGSDRTAQEIRVCRQLGRRVGECCIGTRRLFIAKIVRTAQVCRHLALTSGDSRVHKLYLDLKG